jgi:hypothetical protein
MDRRDVSLDSMQEQDFLLAFEQRVKAAVLQPVGELDGDFMLTDDLLQQWERLQADYVAEAVHLVVEYPEVSVAWAAYLGLAIAQGWDMNWEMIQGTSLKDFYGEQGFDDMDDNILQNHLGLQLNSPEAQYYVNRFQACARMATTCLRREEIPPQSPLAYHCFVLVCKLMFSLGASLRLKHLGYALKRVDI